VSRLYLVRHGEATGDGADADLTAAGVDQVRQLAKRLDNEAVAAIRHSPRRRAVQTAVLLADLLAVPVSADELLDDRTPVPAPGREGDYPDRLRGWFASVPADERDEDGVQLSAAVEAYSAAAGDGPFVLVTHAFVIAWFVRHAVRAPVSAWTAVEMANAGLTTIDYPPGRPPRLIGVNDVGHLRPAKR
jgi:serine/threonine-protein phosphatase PGAM5